MPTQADLPSEAQLLAALEQTWPPLKVWNEGPFCCRDGDDGGQRVSATTLRSGYEAADVISRISAMSAPLFRTTPTAPDEQAVLAEAGLVPHDVTLFRAAPATKVADAPKLAEVFFGQPILGQHRRIWAAGGLGPARVRVMERVAGPKTALLYRHQETPVSAGFVALHGDIAMLHALEVLPTARRQGVGRRMTQAAAFWALEHGATWFALAVTKANGAANAMYQSLGMTVAGGYEYRVRPAGG